jgi:hypothetical protein
MNRSLALLLVFACTTAAQAQEPRWQRRTDAVRSGLEAFHSTGSFNLPTAETMQRGVFQFEISHRFLPPVSDGVQGLWGFDGPVNIRLGLGYAFSDRFMATFSRSNQDDNLDLQVKFRGLEIRNETVPLMIGLLAGGAWSTEVVSGSATDARNFQAYGQLIFNTLIADRLGLGVVPSLLHNAIILDDDVEQTISVGLYAHYYASDLVAFAAEWNISDSIADFSHDAVSFGVQLETGGHFFKLVLTNTTSLNPSQYLLGTPNPFALDELRVGFNVTRLLH